MALPRQGHLQDGQEHCQAHHRGADSQVQDRLRRFRDSHSRLLASHFPRDEGLPH